MKINQISKIRKTRQKLMKAQLDYVNTMNEIITYRDQTHNRMDQDPWKKTDENDKVQEFCDTTDEIVDSRDMTLIHIDDAISELEDVLSWLERERINSKKTLIKS